MPLFNPTVTIDYMDSVKIAADLMSEHGENAEYDRGMVELLCDLYGIPMDNKDDVMNDLRRHKPV